jgi:hypothetical protein
MNAYALDRPFAPHRGTPWIIEDSSEIGLKFNVMPGRPVEERFHVAQYRMWDRYVEATFDREYASTMANSPSHLIFMTALAHGQKMLYLALRHEFGLDYTPDGRERLKWWPTTVDVDIPKLYKQTDAVVQCLAILELIRIRQKAFECRVESWVEDAFRVVSSGRVYLI